MHNPLETAILLSERPEQGRIDNKWVEILHEQKTKVFYTIILTSLKTLHSGFVYVILLLVSIQYVRTDDMSYHLVSVLSLNAMFLGAFGVLSHIPEVLEEASLFASSSAFSYEGTQASLNLRQTAQLAVN